MRKNAAIRKPDVAEMWKGGGKGKGGVNFGPPLPLWVHCVWVESLQDALDFAIRPWGRLLAVT